VSGSELDRVLRSAVRAGALPGVVAAATDRRGVVYLAAFGSAASDPRRALRPDSVFRIASMTKLVTSVAVLQLMEQGRLELDAPFARFFGEFRQPPVLRAFDPVTLEYEAEPAQREITVRQLLTHTAGYGTWFLNPELRALKRGAPEYYNPPFLMHRPGERFQYGISTDVLGQVVRPLSGSTLAEFFEQRILGPLAMRDTAFTLPIDIVRLVSVQTRTPAGFATLPNEAEPEAPRGGSGLYGTAEDYLALLRMLLNGGRIGRRRLLAEATVRELWRNQIGPLTATRQTTAAPEWTADFAFMDGSQKFGFGVLIETRDRPTGRAAGSYGWGGIFNTYFWVDPAAEIAAVLCMQMSPFCAPACLALRDAFEAALYRQLGFSS
jgi:methyl acetate hydrolase